MAIPNAVAAQWILVTRVNEKLKSYKFYEGKLSLMPMSIIYPNNCHKQFKFLKAQINENFKCTHTNVITKGKKRCNLLKGIPKWKKKNPNMKLL